MTQADICNIALSHIGETAKVTSIAPPDGSAQAALCAKFYFVARDSLLEMRRWSFALRRMSPPVVTSELSEWDYAYLLPTDALNVFAVLPAGGDSDYFSGGSAVLSGPLPLGVGRSPVTQDFTIEVDSLGRRILYTDQPAAVIRYVSRFTDTAQYPGTFIMALSWKLAAMLAGPIVKGDAGAAEGRRCIQMMLLHLAAADESDGTQRQIKPPHVPPWIGGR
jgi:hypothetical protein